MKVTQARGALVHRIVTVSEDRYAVFITHRTLRRRDAENGVVSKLAKTLPIPIVSRKGFWGFSNTMDLREKYVRYIDVADIDWVMTGVVNSQTLEMSRRLNRLKGHDSFVDEYHSQIVTIGHHGIETMNLLVSDPTERQQLVDCLVQMRRVYMQVKQTVSNEALLLRYIWYDVDTDQNGLIDRQEFIKILTRINFEVKNAAATYKAFAKQVGGKVDGLTYAQVMALLRQLKNEKTGQGKSMANRIWDEVFGSTVNVVDAAVFRDKFLIRTQGELFSQTEDCHNLFPVMNGMEINVQDEPKDVDPIHCISRERFEVFLYHNLNSAYDPWLLTKDRDVKLTEPMSKYWINTSHNTYLTGDQLKSYSSVEMYLRSMRRGCKCLELDCWDGEKTKAGRCFPVIYHGHTITSKILFADVIRCVRAYIDQHPDTYPIILSLENHCSHPFQRQMAQDLTSILGSILYIPSKADRDGDLPSPEALRGKCVIKGKRPPEPDDTAIEEETEDDPYEPATERTSSQLFSPRKNESGTNKEAKPPKIVEELAKLTLFHGCKYKSFEQSIELPSSHMHSIGETKIGKIIGKKGLNSKLWREFNVRHMTRTYPAGARVDSSNYNPVLAWAVGCQLVALNFQTNDIPLLLNDGLFLQNSSCGYVRKPTSVLLETAAPNSPVNSSGKNNSTAGEKRDPIETLFSHGTKLLDDVELTDRSRPPEVNGIPRTHRMWAFHQAMKELSTPIRLSVRLLSGSCLPKPKGSKHGETIDPYVIVSIHDVQTQNDGSLKYVTSSYTTSVVNNNGFCPIWDEKASPTSEFVVYNPQSAILNFSLNERDIGPDDKVGNASIPITCLRKGYRSVQLLDMNGTRSGAFGLATLLVHIARWEMK